MLERSRYSSLHGDKGVLGHEGWEIDEYSITVGDRSRCVRRRPHSG